VGRASCLATCETPKKLIQRPSARPPLRCDPISEDLSLHLARRVATRALRLTPRATRRCFMSLSRRLVYLPLHLQRAAAQAPLGPLRRANARAAALGVVRDTHTHTRACVACRLP
jgi:hypothetical protein